MRNSIWLSALFLIVFFGCEDKPVYISPNAAPITLYQVVPPNWWAGMNREDLEILIKGEDFTDTYITSSNPAFLIDSVSYFTNSQYIALHCRVTMVQADTVQLYFTKNDTSKVYNYPILPRVNDTNRIVGLTPSDLIYLIMPDRFANGDTANDIVAGMNEATLQRDSMFYRHGGDLKGILDKLDYLEEVGATALWLNPAIENDEPLESYHGYAATDKYKIDARLGTNEQFIRLGDELQKRDMKLVMDVVHNHVGDKHWIIEDLPCDDWVHQQDTFQRTSYRAPTLFDPYASKRDKDIMLNGWFDHHMPDLNQQDPHVANWLLQNDIWWIETAGVDALRMDTYAYSDPDFLEWWASYIRYEYPNIHIFGETWVHGAATQAYFNGGTIMNKKFASSVHGLTDFQLYYAINEALQKDFGWTEGASRIYYTLAKDYMKRDPESNVTFLDNHDLSRFYSMAGEDIRKWKQGIAFLMTTRGIPSIYYGTEILMKNFSDPDGKVREDFPGGWPSDTTTKFNASGRTELEQEAFDFLTTLTKYRKENAAFFNEAKLMQFVPENGVYTYFRYADDMSLMIVLNFSDKEQSINANRFSERIGGAGYSSAADMYTGHAVKLGGTMVLKPWEVLVLELGE